MKKNLLLLICLLITVSIPAQEVSRNLDLKSLQQGADTQPVPFIPAASKILTATSEGTGFKCDSMMYYTFNSAADSVLDIRKIYRNNIGGILYFAYSQLPRYAQYGKGHSIRDEMGNELVYCGKGANTEDKKYSWGNKWENSYDTNGNQIKMLWTVWGEGNWNIYFNWERYYSAEIPDPNISYDWYGWSANFELRNNEGFYYIEPKHDTLFLGDNIYPITGLDTKISRKYDESGVIIFSEGYAWSDVENQWVLSAKEEFMHGPSGLDTLHCGFRWDENEEAWKLDFADTLIRDENGNCIDYKLTHWNTDHSKLILWRRFVAEYDSENRLRNLKYYGGSSSVTDLKTYSEDKYLYDINGNQILYSKFNVQNEIVKDGYKENRYYSPLEISTDASLWDVTFAGLGLRPVVNGRYGKIDEIFDDEIYNYVILNNGSNIIPPMTYIKNDPNSTVVVTEAKDPTSDNKEDRTTTITVTAEDGLTTQNYYFDFYKPNGIATLDTIMVSEGKLYPDFSPEILNYYDTIYGCCNNGVPTPEVTWVKSEPYQYVDLFNASNICNQNTKATRVTVISDNGFDTKYYRITFTVIDTISPVAVCKDTVIYLDETGNAVIDTSGVDGGSTDSCGISNLAIDISAFTIADTGANTITLTVTDNKGNIDQCTSTVTIIKAGVRVNTINSTDFNIHPNPASEVLNIEHNGPMMEVTIYNMLGTEVRKYEMNSVTTGTVQLTGLNKGLYFIQMRDASGQVYTRKVIKD